MKRWEVRFDHTYPTRGEAIIAAAAEAQADGGGTLWIHDAACSVDLNAGIECDCLADLIEIKAAAS